jgi:hypothetical protein
MNNVALVYENPEVAQMELDGEFDYLRQKDWFDPSKQTADLTIIGAGGIGSLFSVMASKMGINEITIIDDDSVEAHNLPNQFYPKSALGMPKVDAIGNVMEDFGIANVTPIEGRINSYSALFSPYIVSGVDSMESRRAIWYCIKSNIENGADLKRYWDARLGGELVTVFSVDLTNPEEMRAYENSTLYSDEEALELPCTRRAVIDVMGYVGSYILTGVRQALAGEPSYGYLFFNAATMFLETASIIDFASLHNTTEEASVPA